MSSESESPAPPSPSPSLSPAAVAAGGQRNPSRSPTPKGGAMGDDNKFTYNSQTGSSHGTPKTKDPEAPQSKSSSHRLSSGLHVSLAAANAPVPTSTPMASSIINELQWHAQQTPPGGPHSPGALSWGGEPLGATSSDKSSEAGVGISSSRLSRKESYKAQRQHYRREKKRAASALLSSLEDPSVIILADWLKIRGSLKSWTKLWCVLKPGILLIYKSPKAKSNHWVGTVLLSACQVIERPSKKDGFCFKLYNPMEQTIWAPRGPHNETIGAVVQPLPTAHLIFRAPSQAAGKCWLDGLELALKCNNILLRTSGGSLKVIDSTTTHETQWSPEDLEKHFHEQVHTLCTRLHDYQPPSSKSSKSFLCTLKTPSETSVMDQSLSKWRDVLKTFDVTDNTENNLIVVNHKPNSRSSIVYDFFKKNTSYTNSLRERLFKDKSPRNASPELSSSLLRIASTFPKRRSSTPSVFTKMDFLKARQHNLNELLLSGRKSAEPRVNGWSPTPDKYSLIDYGRLPSALLNRRMEEAIEERRSQNSPYLSGVILTQKDIDGPSESESEAAEVEGINGLPDTTLSTIKHGDLLLDRIKELINSVYTPETSDHVGQCGEVVEELAEENKSLLWFLIKQVRPGMDLSKVVLPTFILEPRSFLDKLSDSFYHSDILSGISQLPDGYSRMKRVVQWYLSGLYRKPRGLKKPYNPVLGEIFRCCWVHPDSDSKTYYIAEQVSHHPPVSAFYVSNRKEGFAVEATILAKSKFYGNSTSALLEGCARLTLLPLGETYLITFPFAHCKGLLLGTLSMELGGRVVIACPSTHHTTDIEFRLKPFIGGSDSINMVSGRIKHNKDTIANIEGHWDGRIDIKDRRTQEESVLLDVSELKLKRLRRMLVDGKHQGPFESQRLWEKVSMAINQEDQIAATEEKTIIEEAQRERARGNAGREWQPSHFIKGPPLQILDGTTFPHNWQYKHSDLRPWSESSDVLEYEKDFALQTLTRQTTDSDTIDMSRHHDTEHSASETDSTNSHHQRRIATPGQQSVAAALMRVEAALREHGEELAGVREIVRRLEQSPGVGDHQDRRPPLLSWKTTFLAVALAITLHFTMLLIYGYPQR